MNSIALSTLGYISISQLQLAQQAAAQVPLLPPEAQQILVKSLELPLPPSMTTEALGIHQSDVIIRSAIVAAIADLRANPWLLQYAFASLPRDPLTMSAYGEQEVTRAIEWFQKTNVRVFINLNMNEVKFPCISIGLMSSNEQESEGTLGDVHYVSQEDNDSKWPTLVGPITPTAYSAATGIMAFNPAQLNAFVLAPGMLLVDKTGKTYPIIEVMEDNSISIAPGVVADWTDLLIKPQRPAFSTAVESTIYREGYAIGVHVDSEPVHLTYLHSIIVFALLRYKQALLEARGFERSTLSSADVRMDPANDPENVYSRYIQITGTVRQAWPKQISPKAAQVAVQVTATQAPADGGTVIEEVPVDVDTEDALSDWLDSDAASGKPFPGFDS